MLKSLISILAISSAVVTQQFKLETDMELTNKIIRDLISILYGNPLIELLECPSISKEKINIYFVSSINPQEQYTITPDNFTNFQMTKFNASLETKILTHGWLSGGKVDWLEDMRNKYLTSGDCNVFTIGWDLYSINPYSITRCYVEKIGETIGNFIHNFTETTKLNLDNIHLIGHSLGAHLLAKAAQTVQELSGGKKIGRITGLDPAGPLYCHPAYQTPEKRLSEDDAVYVDVIHTNDNVFGCGKPIGHANFLPNCGSLQPGCSVINIVPLDVLKTFQSFLKTIMCSHGRSTELWIESIANKNFKALECSNCPLFLTNLCTLNDYTRMGEVSRKVKGKFYFHTSDRIPYV